METIKSYKCPCCSAPLVFSAKSQGFHCESCGNDFPLETMQQLDPENGSVKSSAFNWDSYEPRNYSAEEAVDLSAYSCPSCGAEITGDDTAGSTVCPYCGNSVIIKKQFEGALRPDFIVPFKVDKKAAMAQFEKAYQNAPFLPDEFKNKKKIEEMAGVYVPFWMFDCDCNAEIRYNATRTTHWSDSKYDYTKTDYFKLIRAGSIGFANIPVDGSKKADDDYMEALEPFNYGDAVEFSPAYLSGFLADKYDVSAEESSERANKRVKNSTEAAFMQTTVGYHTVLPEDSFVSFGNGKIRYSLLPVWMLNIKYDGKNYKYAVNGQTGKTVGEYPISKKKRNAYFAKVLGIALAACLAAATVFVSFL